MDLRVVRGAVSSPDVDWREVFDALADAVVVADEQNRVCYANAATTTLLGWAPADLVGRPLTTLVPERLRAAHVAGFRRLVAGGTPTLLGREVVVPALQADGSERDVALTITSVDGGGKARFAAVLRTAGPRLELEQNTSAARRLHEALAHVPARGTMTGVLAALAEALGWSAAALWTPDHTGERLRCTAFWSAPAADVGRFRALTMGLELSRGEGLPGRAWADDRPHAIDATAIGELPRGPAAIAADLGRAVAHPVGTGGRVSGVVELWGHPPPGAEEAVAAMLRGVQARYAQAVERWLAHVAILEGQERLALALDAAGMAAWEWDVASGRGRLSHAARQIFGLDANFDGTYQAWLSRVRPEHRAQVEAAIAATLREGAELHVEHAMVAPSGEQRWVEARGRAIRDGRSRVVQVAGVVMDVTDRKHAEQERDRLSREREHVIDVLQSSLLPPHLPDVPGLELAARYVPAGTGEVGGDFYDVFPMRGRSWGVVIGDVCGKGPQAAALTAMVRYSLRAAAMHTRRPQRVLADVNAAMLLGARDRGEEPRFCTIAFARLEPRDETVQLHVAGGGHPGPLVLRRDATVEHAGAPGMLVGTFPDAEFGARTTLLGPGDSVCFYTDGVTEARMGGSLYGERRLRELLARHAGDSAEQLAQAVHDEVLGVSAGSRPRDDLAIFIVRVPN